MSGEVFLDTNIVVYGIVHGDSRSATAASLLRQGGIISVQVLNEFTNVAHRKFRREWSDITIAINALKILLGEPRPITAATHATALAIAEQYGFAFYDSLIVASALEANCSTLLSEDLQHGQVIDRRLTVSNPFR